MHDELGARMKEQYEMRSQTYLSRRTYTIIRLDGKAFHTLTRGCEKPFDTRLMTWMDGTALRLCEEIQGCVLAYTQSDEISLLLTDFAQINTQSYFDGNVQKICSISASIATATFNYWSDFGSLAFFDSRCFIIPDPIEVSNYFVWRQKDATRNAINMVGQSMYSHKQLHNKNVNEVQEMIFQKGKNFNDYPDGFKRGRCCIKRGGGEHSKWTLENPPIFTQDPDYLKNIIPIHPDFCRVTSFNIPVIEDRSHLIEFKDGMD